MSTSRLAKKIRKHVVMMTHRGNSSHVGSCLSIADLVAVMYGEILTLYPDNPQHKNRDRFILSKGHAGAAVYAALAEKEFFAKEVLETHYKNGSILSGHVSHKGIPGVELSTGSLGHGLSVGVGMALNAKLQNENHRVFVLMGDGECDEGSVWEAAMFSAHHKLDNLVAIVDHNKIQSLAQTKNTINLDPFADKWKSFGWKVTEIDGHNHEEILPTLKNIPAQKNKPTCIIAHTTKGKGVSFMENSVLWHYRSPQGEEFKAAIQELEA